MKTKPEILCQPALIKPLHRLNPRTIKGQDWWDINRREAYMSTNYHCLACGVHKDDALYHQWLEGHESYKINFNRHSYTLESIIPLCHACHNFIHSGRLEALMVYGKITKKKYRDIMKRGRKILKDNKLDKNEHLNKLCGGNRSLFFPEYNDTWELWHLDIDGSKYYSLFESFEHWKSYYRKFNK